MTDSAGLQHSLAAIGFVELALAFCCLTGYSLLLSGALRAKARRVAGALALLAAVALAALADPWTNGVILVALGIAGIGLFVVAAWGVSAACGLTRRRLLEPKTALPNTGPAPTATPAQAEVPVPSEPAARPAAPSARTRPGAPAHPA
jgi:hypothetical protein